MVVTRTVFVKTPKIPAIESGKTFLTNSFCDFEKSFLQPRHTKYATIPIKNLGTIAIRGFEKMGFAVIIARINDAMPRSVPPTNILRLSPVTDIAIASGRVKAAGVKLPSNALKRYVSISKNTKTSASITPRNATFLAVLDKGKVAECGTHDELMRKKGIYYGLVMAQRQMSGRKARN